MIRNGVAKRVTISPTRTWSWTRRWCALTRHGMLVCSGDSNGEMLVYNLTTSAPVLRLYTRPCAVTALLLLCLDGHVSVVDVLASDGQVAACQCHDYYVFSLGADDAV